MAAAHQRRFGAYVLQRRLGVGGMAETFVARREGPGGVEQVVCLKRVLPAFNHDRDFVALFQREARLAGALRHSNIVGVVDYGEVAGEQFMALELVDGVDLRGLLASLPDRKLDPELAALVALDLAYALEYAHNAQGGIVHRDLTPSNVLLSKHGEVKLADFGVAKALTGATVATATGFVKGKVPYMAPEQMRGGKVDARVDLFALGATLFESLAGRRPFVGQHDVEIMMKVVEGQRPKLKDLAPEVPADLAALVERLLATDPDGRPADAGEVIDALAPSVRNVSRARDRLAALVRDAYGDPAAPDAPLDTALAPASELPVEEASAVRAVSSLPPPVGDAGAPQDVREGKPTLMEMGPPAALVEEARRSSAPPASVPPPAPGSSEALELPASWAPPGSSSRRWAWVVAAAAALVGLGVVGALGLTPDAPEPTSEPLAARPPSPLPTGLEAPAPSAPPASAWPSASAPPDPSAPAEPSASTPAEPDPSAPAEPGASPSSMGGSAGEGAAEEPAETAPAPSGTQGSADAESPPPATERPRERPDPAPARVRVSVVPWGKVWLGRRLLGRAPQTVELGPGRHRIRAGYDAPLVTKTVVVREGQTRRSVTIELPEM